MDHDEVHDRSSFAAYVTQRRAELDDPQQAARWENADLSSFLEAMAAWVSDGNQPATGNPWRHAADLLTAAIVYE